MMARKLLIVLLFLLLATQQGEAVETTYVVCHGRSLDGLEIVHWGRDPKAPGSYLLVEGAWCGGDEERYFVTPQRKAEVLDACPYTFSVHHDALYRVLPLLTAATFYLTENYQLRFQEDIDATRNHDRPKLSDIEPLIADGFLSLLDEYMNLPLYQNKIYPLLMQYIKSEEHHQELTNAFELGLDYEVKKGLSRPAPWSVDSSPAPSRALLWLASYAPTVVQSGIEQRQPFAKGSDFNILARMLHPNALDIADEMLDSLILRDGVAPDVREPTLDFHFAEFSKNVFQKKFDKNDKTHHKVYLLQQVFIALFDLRVALSKLPSDLDATGLLPDEEADGVRVQVQNFFAVMEALDRHGRQLGKVFRAEKQPYFAQSLEDLIAKLFLASQGAFVRYAPLRLIDDYVAIASQQEDRHLLGD